jgi:DNA-binding response OmpR family regulator/HPt (histidine-containing phosphotransfer) domain-containing protein
MGSWPEETGAFAAILIDEEWAEAENWSPPASGQILWLRMTGRSAELDHRPLLPSPLTPARLSRAVAALAAPEVSPTQQFALDSHTQGRRILLVEDSPAGQLYFRKLLASQAYDVTVASTAADAHSLARSAVFDLILMDIQLPDGSGIDVIRELRASEDAAGRARVPIIALSAHALADCKASALAAGADDYITKPVRVGELLKGVRQRLVRRVNVLILAQSQTLLDAALRLCPSASGILIGEDGEFQVPFTEEPFRVVILIADGPSVSFVSSAFKSLKEFPPERLLLLGDRWPRECVNLAGGAEALPVPESASALDRLVQLTASHTAPEAGTDLSSKFAKEIAILAPSYLKELNDSISNARGDLAAGNLSQLAGFAHRVKGSGAAYGFPTLTLLAAKLEEAARQEDRSVAARTLESLADEISQALVRKNAI